MLQPQIVGVIGAGTIGREVAYWLASAYRGDMRLVLVDTNPDALAKARQHVEGLVAKALKKSKLSERAADAVKNCVQYTLDLRDLSEAELVVEAATERLDLKRVIVHQVHGLVGPECFICTTTSSLTASAIFADLPEDARKRCFVLHPFTPVWRSLPMEVVGADGNPASERLADLCAFVTRMGKVPILVMDRACFAGNVIFCGLMNYACKLLDQGHLTPGQINRILADELGGGGVFAVHNFIGPYSNGLTLHCVREMHDALGDAFAPSPALVAKAADGGLWDLSDDGEEEGIALAVARIELLGALFGLVNELLMSEVISPAELNFLTRAAFGWNVGIIEKIWQYPEAPTSEYNWKQMIAHAVVGQLAPPTPSEAVSEKMLEEVTTGLAGGYFLDILVQDEFGVDEVAGVVTITVYRPDVKNALRRNTLIEIRAILEELQDCDDVEGVIFTGWNGVLAGADVNEIAACKTPDAFATFPILGQQLTMLIQEFKKPIIAVITGYCLGGGAELAMACHRRFISPKAVVGQPEVTLGIIPGYGATQRLPRLIGLRPALDWMRSGRLHDARSLVEVDWGFLCENPMASAMVSLHNPEWRKDVMQPSTCWDAIPAARLPSLDSLLAEEHWGSQGASRAIDRVLCAAVLDGLRLSVRQGLVVEALAMREVAACADCREGLDAFLAKRKPVWQHK